MRNKIKNARVYKYATTIIASILIYKCFNQTRNIHSDDFKSIPFNNDGSSLRTDKSQGDCMVSYGKYNGNSYRSPEFTVENTKCLVESKWMKVMQHKVDMEGNIIEDWLWIDYHDRINVLVQEKKDSFVLFRQTKYALEGRESLAIIGGIIEPGETPEKAARREVFEELHGMTCARFIFLGRFRTDVNRGIGWVNSFVASDCDVKKIDTELPSENKDEVGAADAERQDIVRMNLSQLRKSITDGKFLEVQWSNTVALAMLHPEIL